MTYGYRLNVEQVMLAAADRHWELAKREMREVRDEDVESAKRFTFIAPVTDEGLIAAVQTVIGWAVCLEALANLAWNQSKGENAPRHLSSVEKLVKLTKGIESDKTWLQEIRQLFELRNYLVHYKEVIEYVGFSFAPPYLKRFEKTKMDRYREALTAAVLDLGAAAGVPVDFVKGGRLKVVYLQG